MYINVFYWLPWDPTGTHEMSRNDVIRTFGKLIIYFLDSTRGWRILGRTSNTNITALWSGTTNTTDTATTTTTTTSWSTRASLDCSKNTPIVTTLTFDKDTISTTSCCNMIIPHFTSFAYPHLVFIWYPVRLLSCTLRVVVDDWWRNILRYFALTINVPFFLLFLK